MRFSQCFDIFALLLLCFAFTAFEHEFAVDLRENMQLMPDIQVKSTFDELVNNIDQQIEKAVEELPGQIR